VSESTDLDKIDADMRRFADVLHQRGLVKEWKMLRDVSGYDAGTRELFRRHPELSCELDVEALAS